MLHTKLDENGEEFEYCPEHGKFAETMLDGWGCPVALEGDPEDAETCPYFIEMIEERSKDIEDGNYFVMIFPARLDREAGAGHPGGDDHRMYAQEYRNHIPVGSPKPVWDDEPLEGYLNAELDEEAI